MSTLVVHARELRAAGVATFVRVELARLVPGEDGVTTGRTCACRRVPAVLEATAELTAVRPEDQPEGGSLGRSWVAFCPGCAEATVPGLLAAVEQLQARPGLDADEADRRLRPQAMRLLGYLGVVGGLAGTVRFSVAAPPTAPAGISAWRPTEAGS